MRSSELKSELTESKMNTDTLCWFSIESKFWAACAYCLSFYITTEISKWPSNKYNRD